MTETNSPGASRTRSLYTWFSDAAARYPDRPALDLPDRVVTYRQLQEAALSAAAWITQAHGRVPRRIGLMAARTAETYAAYLGILALGAAVVPLSPEHPRRRTLDICALAEIDLVLHTGSAAIAGPSLTVPLVELRDFFRASDSAPTGTDPTRPAAPDDIAYIMFTSGSTGTPKGVPIRNRNISAYLASWIRIHDVRPESRLSQVIGMTFDASVCDLFCAWGAGAAVVVPGRQDLHRPVDYIVDRNITHWNSVPSVISLAQGLGNLPEGAATGLQHSILGGERVTTQLCSLWRRVAPHTRIHTAYGPTEAAIMCTSYQVPSDPARWPSTANDSMPIGKRYPEVETLVLDDAGHPAEEGELCLRGTQRFDGYLDGEQNEGRFLSVTAAGAAIPVPPGTAIAPEHWYRTGDRVRDSGGGRLIHLGRLDEQVKIAGHRMELGEIEASMARLPEIDQAVVLADTRSAEVQLVAVYRGTPLPPQEVARRLREVLPRQMVPRVYQHVEHIPLNSNGKTDRRQLLAELL